MKINYLPYEDDDIYYCRGMTSAMRTKMRERREAQKRLEEGKKSEPTTQNNQQPEKKGLIQKIKGWFA